MIESIDIHCHPSLKYHLFGTNITNDAAPPDDETVFDLPNLKNLYVSLPRMNRGNVGMVWASHYIPEHDLIRLAKILPGVRELLLSLLKETLNKFEDVSSPNAVYKQTVKLVEDFTHHIESSGAVCPKDLQAMKNARSSGKKVFLHTVEGAHHLGRNRVRDGKPDIQAYLDALAALFKRGVCSMTLGHFFPNDCVSPVNGMPPNVIRTLAYPTTFPDTGLSMIGEAVVRWMLENGMIVDMTHCSPLARMSVFTVNRDRAKPRPLIFSHTGVAEVFKQHAAKEHLNDYVLNPSDDEIREIQKCNGVIGIILNMYWLRGQEEPDRLLGLIPDPGLLFAIETIKHIRDVTGSYENIAIGSDFDGFTDVLDDVPDISAMPKIAQSLLDSGVPSSGVERIMSLNALRVLESGWGK